MARGYRDLSTTLGKTPITDSKVYLAVNRKNEKTTKGIGQPLRAKDLRLPSLSFCSLMSSQLVYGSLYFPLSVLTSPVFVSFVSVAWSPPFRSSCLLVSGRHGDCKTANQLPARELCMVVRSQLLSWLTWTGWMWRDAGAGPRPPKPPKKGNKSDAPNRRPVPMAPKALSLQWSVDRQYVRRWGGLRRLACPQPLKRPALNSPSQQTTTVSNLRPQVFFGSHWFVWFLTYGLGRSSNSMFFCCLSFPPTSANRRPPV